MSHLGMLLPTGAQGRPLRPESSGRCRAHLVLPFDNKRGRSLAVDGHQADSAGRQATISYKCYVDRAENG
jgi:hypothetical protein